MVTICQFKTWLAEHKDPKPDWMHRKCCHTFAQDINQPDQLLQEQHKPATGSDDDDDTTHPGCENSVCFVGDLNPESVLADLSERPKNSTRQSRVRVWIGLSNERQDLPSNLEAPDWSSRTSQLKRPRNSGGYMSEPSSTSISARYGAFTVLPAETQRSLIKLYISHVHPFLLLTDVDSFLSSFEQGKASNFLILAICLTASKFSEAAPSLRWKDQGSNRPCKGIR